MAGSDIKDVMTEFCEAGAEAIRCYADVSGLDPLTAPYMPEYFMQSFMFQRLGRTRAIILEPNLDNLIRWNDSARQRHISEPNEAEIIQFAARAKNPRFDMVVFDGQEVSASNLLLLVEFKNGEINFQSRPARISDLQKLLENLPLIETCPYGVICGWIGRSWLNYYKDEIQKLDATLHQLPVPGHFASGKDFLFGALVISNPGYIAGGLPVSRV